MALGGQMRPNHTYRNYTYTLFTLCFYVLELRRPRHDMMNLWAELSDRVLSWEPAYK